MKKLIVLLLILVVFVVSGFSGCLQKTGPATNNATPGITASNTVTAVPGTMGNLTISAATISSDIESISKEAASIDTNNTGITPINDTVLTVD